MKRRVVVTGLGAVTPIGNTVDVFWDEIKKGTVGIGPITQFDVSDYKVKIAAQVKGFDARERLDFKSAKEWNCLHNTRRQQRKRRLKMPESTWKRKILTGQA